jgi:hypothetical protein
MGDSARPSTNSDFGPSTILTQVRPLASLKVRDTQSKLATPEKERQPLQLLSKNATPDGSNPEDEPALQQLRQVEQGLLGTPCQVVFYLTFKAFPIWLLTLDSSMLSQVCLMGVATQDELVAKLQEQGVSGNLIRAAIANVGSHKVTYTLSNVLPPEAVSLVSGLLPFVKNWNRRAANPTLVLCDKHVRSKQTKYGNTLRWSRLRHDTFGGVTNFQAMLGANIPGFEPSRTTLRRIIRHVLDYTLKPKWAPPPLLGEPSPHLSVNERLHPDDFTKSVLYHTHYLATGWGSQQLSIGEVGIAFGWPAWARKINLQLNPSFPSVPVQIMDGCLKGILDSIPKPIPSKHLFQSRLRSL